MAGRLRTWLAPFRQMLVELQVRLSRSLGLPAGDGSSTRSARLLFLLSFAAVPVPGAPNPPPLWAGLSFELAADDDSADADGLPMPSPIGFGCRVDGFDGIGGASRDWWIDGLTESDGVKYPDDDRVDCTGPPVGLADSGREKLGGFGETVVDMVLGRTREEELDGG